MMEKATYVPYSQIVGELPVHKGDIIYVISDILEIAKSCREHGEKFDCAEFLRTVCDAVGADGTVLVPTFSWDFCKGIAFDYCKSKGKTGALGNAALAMPEFKRTRHPLYSFAVWGRDSDYLLSIDPPNGWSEDSIFAYMHKKQAKALVVGINSLKGNTFIHYVEQSVGVEYRYYKNFSADYIDEHGNCSEKTYTMYVRDLSLNPMESMQEIERMIDQLGINKSYIVNGIPFHITDLSGLYEIGKLDILFNRAKNLYRY